MGDSLSSAWNVAIIMKYLVLIGSVLACVSSVPQQPVDDGYYGVPAAPVIDSPPPVLIPVNKATLVPTSLNTLNPFSTTNLINRDLNIDITRTVAIPAPLVPSQPLVVPAPLAFPQPIPAPVALPAAQPLAAPVALPPQPFAAPVPLPVAQPLAAPIPAPLVPAVAPPSSQFHAQDEFGQFSFGYQNINSARSETKDAFGVTRGSYQYVDANNGVQTVHYTADDVNGFRVAATNVPVAPAAAPLALPVAPEAPAALALVAPVPVVETPEVAAARAEHLEAHEKAKAQVAAAEES